MSSRTDQYSLNLFSNIENTEIYKKPVQATQILIANGIMTGQQVKAWNTLLKHAKEQNDAYNLTIKAGETKKPRTFRINRLELMDKMGYKSTNRKHFKEALIKMQDLKATWDILGQDGNNAWASCVLLPFLVVDNEYVHYSFVEHIEPMLFNSEIFHHLNLGIQRLLKRDESVKLYDWVSRYKTNPSKRTNCDPWELWRWIIYGEVDKKSYLQEYKLFKRDKLLPAIKEINEVTDIMLELIENKDGSRRVKELQFKITEKPKFNSKEGETKEIVDVGPTLKDINDQLQKLDISNYYKKKLTNFYDLALIQANIQYTISRMNDQTQDSIKNLGAYLLKACEQDYAGFTKQKAQNQGSGNGTMKVSDVLAEFQKVRTDDAIRMFGEMPLADQEQKIAQYNAVNEHAEQQIPSGIEDRHNRHMIPFYQWLAKTTWGDPTPEEIIEFTMKIKK